METAREKVLVNRKYYIRQGATDNDAENGIDGNGNGYDDDAADVTEFH